MTILYKAIYKLRFIAKLVVSTPRYALIIGLQFLSGVFSIVGLPLLIPVLDYMREGASVVGGQAHLVFIERLLVFFNLEPGFHAILTIASILIIMGQFLVFVSTLIAANAQAELSEQYRRKIFNAYSQANWLWLVNCRSGEINYSIIREAEMSSVAHLNAQRVLIYFIQVVVLLYVVIKLSLVITLLAVGIFLCLTFINVLNSNRIYKLAGLHNLQFTKLSNDLNVLLQNKKFFKTSLLNVKLIKTIFELLKDLTRILKKENVRLALQQSLSLMVTFLFLALLMFFHKQFSLSYSVLLLILLVFLRIAPQFGSLSAAYAALDSNIPMYQTLHRRLNDLYNHKEENGREQFMGNRAVRFKNVSFTYPNGNKVFDNLNATIEPYKATAFIGSSGVGKSTLLDLILGLLKPDSGFIYYGDIPHTQLDKNSIRNKIAYVAQDTTLVDGSMRENLTIVNPKLTDENIRRVALRVGLDKVIDEMPEQLNTPIGENGIKLSGGQRQRVALARALFMEPQILILDEATSSLDSESERLIQETIKSLQKDFTIIIVTHKLSAVRFADKIYVLEKGSVKESGNYQELLEQKGKLYFFDSLQK